MEQIDNYVQARKLFTNKVNEQLNDPTAYDKYARALGYIEGLVIGMLIDVPEACDYIIKRYEKI